jgi:DNA-directed RNA polymerase specialized sigma24 family protein
MNESFDRLAAELYSMASMLVGEGEQSAGLVESAVANAEVTTCDNLQNTRMSSRRVLCSAALELLAQRNPRSLWAPIGLMPSTTCIDDDDLASAGISAEELEKIIDGPERDRMRNWLASLPTRMRAVFVMRAVAGFSTAETAGLLQKYGGAQSGPLSAAWTPEVVREVFRQGLCSLASQLLHASAGKIGTRR